MTKKIKGITGLRNDLLEIYAKSRGGKVDYNEINSIVNTAGKILKTAKLQIEYQAHRGQNKAISFLED